MVFTLAALGLADLPPFATYLGKGWIEDTGTRPGGPGSPGVLIACSILVGAAVLRVAGGVFYGLGDPPAEDSEMAAEASEETSETERAAAHAADHDRAARRPGRRGPRGRACCPHLGSVVQAAAVRFQDQHAYNAVCCPAGRGPPGRACTRPRAPGSPWPTCSAGPGSAAGGAVILAGLALYWQTAPAGCAAGPNRACCWAIRSAGSRAVWSTTT